MSVQITKKMFKSEKLTWVYISKILVKIPRFGSNQKDFGPNLEYFGLNLEDVGRNVRISILGRRRTVVGQVRVIKGSRDCISSYLRSSKTDNHSIHPHLHQILFPPHCHLNSYTLEIQLSTCLHSKHEILSCTYCSREYSQVFKDLLW